MIGLIFWASIFLLLGCLSFQMVFLRSRAHLRHLKKREALSSKEIMKRYYPDLKVSCSTFDELWSDIAESFDVPPGLIRPGDMFGKELLYKGLVSDEDLFLSDSLCRRMKEIGIEKSIPPMNRVDDYIRFLASN